MSRVDGVRLLGPRSFGYVTNLWSFRPDDPRAANLAGAVRSCLG